MKFTLRRAIFQYCFGWLCRLHALTELSRWCDFVAASTCPIWNSREDLYEQIQQRIAGPIDYLEFGVANGASLKIWARINTHPESRLIGFDSFEGLPEDWYRKRPKGTFSRGGELPHFEDERVGLQVGWFQKSLPRFLGAFQPRNPLVIHCDADLYSSTLYVLTQLDRVAKPGTIVIFDEFWSAEHEFRAFMDYAAAYQKQFQLIGATKRYAQLALYWC